MPLVTRLLNNMWNGIELQTALTCHIAIQIRVGRVRAHRLDTTSKCYQSSMIIAFAYNQIESVYDDIYAVRNSCDPSDVEEGAYDFFDDAAGECNFESLVLCDDVAAILCQL